MYFVMIFGLCLHTCPSTFNTNQLVNLHSGNDVMRLNTIYDFINDAERFTCDGSRCTLYLNTGLDVIDYFDIDADYVGGCSLYVSQQFMYHKLTGASDNEWYRDTGVIHLHVRRISDSNVWRVHVCSCIIVGEIK